MTTPPQISVIIPTYNYAGSVQAAIESVIAQLDDNAELIVVDDGSTDDTETVLARLSFPSNLAVRLLRQANAGPAAARNHGMRLAKGNYLLFLDADDQLLPGALAGLIGTIRSNPKIELVLGGYITMDIHRRERLSLPSAIDGPPEKRIRDYLLDKNISIVHGASLFRKSLLERRPYPESLRQAEDIPVFAYMIAHARTICLAQPLARIFKHPDSLRHNASLSHLATAGQVAALVFAELPASCQPLRPAYEAQRMLSMFRTLYLAGFRSEARRCYHAAFHLDKKQALRSSYLSKYLRLMFYHRHKK